jgi:hypothetical protein
VTADPAALEEVEFRATADLFRAAPPHLRTRYGIGVELVGTTTCFVSRDCNPPAMFRRAAGLGLFKPATLAELADVLNHMREAQAPFCVTVSPHTKPVQLSAWLEARGFARGYAWMKFSRPCAEPYRVDTPVSARLIGPEHAADFGRIVTEGFGLGADLIDWLAVLPNRKGWLCALAFAGELPIAASAAYVDGPYAWFGLTATLPSHRLQGAQSALLSLRLETVAERDVRIAVIETGERVPDKASRSYQNILRAGFKEEFVRQNYLSPS